MGRGATLKAQFNAGELSPLLDGRVDLQKYANGCSVLENFVPTVHGPVRRRPGARFVQDVSSEDASVDPVLVPFVYNREQAYVLAFCNNGIRVFSDRGWVVTPPGIPYIFGTSATGFPVVPRDTNGLSRLSYAQSGDVLYVADGISPLRKITRLADDDWTVEYVYLSPPPVELVPIPTDVDEVEKRELYIWWDATDLAWYAHIYFDKSEVFSQTFGGVLVWEDDGSMSSVRRTWGSGLTMSLGQFLVVDGRWYQAVKVTGGAALDSVRPTHTIGTKVYGDVTLRAVGNGRFYWDILYTDLAAPSLTGWTGKKMAEVRLRPGPTAPLESIMHPFWVALQTDSMSTRSYGFESIGTAIADGSFPDLTSRAPFPSKVCFFRDRLVVSAGEKVFFSAPGDYERFDLLDPNGEVTADAGISIEIAKGDVASISWMVASDVLVLGTMSAEWVISEQSGDQPFGADNIKLEQYGATGSSLVAPIRVDSDVLYLSRTRSKLLRLGWSRERESYLSSDLSVLSDHFGRAGFRDMTFQRDPSAVLWACDDAGDLAGFTYDREQDVLAWHRHDIGGEVLAVCSIPSPDGSRDDLWVAVRREIDGEDRVYLEVMTDDRPFGGDVRDSFFVDSGLTYSGSPVSTVSGLTHLEGETVQLLVDGSTHPDVVVASGAVALVRPGSKVHVGLHHSARLRTMRVEAAADDGVAQGKTKRIHKVTCRVLETVGLMVGPSWDKLDRVEFRTASDPMSGPVPPFTGDKSIAFRGDYGDDGYVCVEQNQPLPCTLIALIPELQVNS